jgi:hypothetical protein
MWDSNYNDIKEGSLSAIDVKPVDLYVTDSGTLVMLEDDTLWAWDCGSSYMPFKWESRALDFGGAVSLTAARVKSKGVSFRIWPADTPDLYFEKFVTSNKAFRLKRLGRHRRYKIGLYGNTPVERLELATSILTLEVGV